ncbi:hypothetical protein OV906_25275, partial [Salmonella enterica subsp. enterica serovar 1,4,[5],12:i:-]|nr:hypothetical protein [Salmonella enterica subsp. enterica serovar 1,4,[5],12:i:-]
SSFFNINNSETHILYFFLKKIWVNLIKVLLAEIWFEHNQHIFHDNKRDLRGENRSIRSLGAIKKK